MRFGGHVPEARYPFAKNDADANVQDIDYLARLTEVDRSFSDEARVEFARRVAKLKERAALLSRGELLMGIARALAVADNPHTNVERAYWRAYLNSAPVRLEWFDEGLYIVRARETQASLLGYRVAAIDGKAPELVVRDASHYFGGPPEHGRVSSLLVMESPQALHVLYLDAPSDRLALSLDDGSGNVANVELPAVDPHDAPPVVKPGRLLSPESDFGEKPGEWEGVIGHSGVGRNQRPERSETFFDQPAQSGIKALLAEACLRRAVRPSLVHPQRWARPPRRATARGVQAGASMAADRHRPALRHRRGLSRPLPCDRRASLAPHARRKVIVITDNTTFSAAIITAALVKHFAGEREVIVGDARATACVLGRGGQMRFPLKIEIPFRRGCTIGRGCDSLRATLAQHCNGPSALAPWSPTRVGKFEDYRRGIDTVLEAALR
jgi:hypothetical protein